MKNKNILIIVMCFIWNVLSSDCIKEKTLKVSFIEFFSAVGVLAATMSILYYTIKISAKMISLLWSAKKEREQIKKEYTNVELSELNDGLYSFYFNKHDANPDRNANEETDYDEDMMPKVEDAKKDLIVVEFDRIKEIIVINKDTKKLLLSIGLMMASSTVFFASHKKEEMMK